MNAERFRPNKLQRLSYQISDDRLVIRKQKYHRDSVVLEPHNIINIDYTLPYQNKLLLFLYFVFTFPLNVLLIYFIILI